MLTHKISTICVLWPIRSCAVPVNIGLTGFNLVVDGKTLARVVVPNINNMTRAAGKPVLLY